MSLHSFITPLIGCISTITIYSATNSSEIAIFFLFGFVLSKILDSALNIYKSKKVTLYIGNLPYKAHDYAVKELFSKYGEVHSLRLVKDRFTGKRKGFGFIEMSAGDAKKALKKLNEAVFHERTIVVRVAKTQEEKD